MDDLLDLNWSDSSKQSQPALRPQSSSSTSRQPTPNPTFDFLSKQSNTATPNYLSTSTPPLRSATPKTAPLPSQARLPPTPAIRSSTPNPSHQAKPTAPSSSSDAFSSLLSLNGSGSSKPNGQAVSLAERQQQIADEKRKKEEHERQQFTAEGSFWDNLGSSSTSSSVPSPALGSVKAPSSGGIGEFDDLLSPQPVRPIRPPSTLSKSVTPIPTPPVAKEGVWDDDDTFLAGPSTKTSGPSSGHASRSGDPFDFDALDKTVNRLKAPGAGTRNGSSGMRTPVSNFDFGDGDGGRSRDEEDDEDDFLGELGRPAKPLAERSHSPPARQPQNSHKKAPRSSSPPPHIVGALFEMGFDPAAARAALAQTATGVDVQAAVEILTAQQEDNGLKSSRFEDEDKDEDHVMRERQRREEADAERRRRRRAGPSRESVQARSRDEIDRQGTPNGEYGEQAEKILAQASEIGQSFMKSATSFWSSGKEKALKIYEEQRKAMELEGQKGKRREGGDGRPRWMVEAEEREEYRSEKASSGFKDSDEEGPEEPVRRPVNGHSKPRQTEPRPTQRDRQRMDDDLLGGDAPKSYQPAGRHRPTSRSTPASTSARPKPRAKTPPPLIQRTIVPASASQIQSSSTYKAKGNEHFKLGRFSEAESAYSGAITQLPEGNLFLVPIYNNRAATRNKLGESASAVQDCTIVIDLIGFNYHPTKEAPLPAEYAEVKLGDALVKAVTKRAQALEMGEKWSKAVEDWERVLGFDIALMGANAQSTKSLASEGIRRSRKMLEPQPDPTTSAPKPKPKPATATRPVKPADTAKSQAVGEMRKANQAAEAEDAQRLASKDSVDAKVVAWKGGKEANLRALIASLDTVLWDEIMSGGLKVGMHELITEKQVKIKYMKVIARLHPDKLDTKKTTVEQRMLANAAFSSLNDAWQAFNNT